MFWQGHVLNSFNGIFKHHMQEFVEILTTGLLIEIGTSREIYDVHIHILIADSPARAKITYYNQFNGGYGCFTCMNSGLKIGKKKPVYTSISAKFNLDPQHSTSNRLKKSG